MSRTMIKPLIPHVFPSLSLIQPIQHQARVPRSPGLAVPFFRDPVHTIPTKRLYRHLLRATYRFPLSRTLPATKDAAAKIGMSPEVHLPSALPGRGLTGIRLRCIRDWRKRRGWTSPAQTALFLSAQAALLRQIETAQPSAWSDVLALNFSLGISHTRHKARIASADSARQAALAQPAH
jgi:hypothetical protein